MNTNRLRRVMDLAMEQSVKKGSTFGESLREHRGRLLMRGLHGMIVQVSRMASIEIILHTPPGTHVAVS
jgi:hypothetical protein